MMHSFIRVDINGIDLSSMVRSLKFEDNVDKDGYAKFEFHSDKSLQVLDEDIHEKDKVTFQFGILGEKVSKVFHYVVSDIETVYKTSVVLTITCIDKGSFLKKEDFSKTWLNVTASEIAADIAFKHGLKADITTTTTRYKSIVQSNETDQAFLEKLAGQEKSGLWKTRIESDTLYFGQRDYKKAAKKSFTYGSGDGGVISFNPKYKETQNDAATNETVVKGIDPLNKEVLVGEVIDTAVATGKKVVQYSVNGDYKGVREIVVPFSDKAAVDGVANSNTQEAKKKVLTASLDAYPDPNILAGDIITMAGVHKKHSGNWYTETATHDITAGSAYKMSLELNRNASKSAFNKNAKDAKTENKTTGPDQTESTKPVRVYDVNGQQVPTQTGTVAPQ